MSSLSRIIHKHNVPRMHAFVFYSISFIAYVRAISGALFTDSDSKKVKTYSGLFARVLAVIPVTSPYLTRCINPLPRAPTSFQSISIPYASLVDKSVRVCTFHENGH